MSYQVLARKWRPKDFAELVGQQQTAQALINALESQRLHHAYLFTGTRGVGKTTIARILSKSLNCETGITSKPCGECASCIEISQGNFVDLLEIDAASKTKVEDTRELLDNVQYRPTRGRYKVYLIDEVHMLSGHSFNALLKTLEEPPPHVIFLLATTDPQKMPVTVLSRCLQFHLRRMEEDEIINHLTKILLAENIESEPGAIEPIAKGADGSMRDALSLLDQAIAYCGESILKQTVLDMLGSIDREYAFQLLEAIREDDASNLMQVIDRIAQYSPDYDELLSDWLSLLHQIAITQATRTSDDARIQQLANEIRPADIQLFYQLSLHARRDLGYTPHPRQGFEMAMLRIIAFKPQTGPVQPKKAAVEDPVKHGLDSAEKKTLKSDKMDNEAILERNISSVQAAPTPELASRVSEVESAQTHLKVVVDNEATIGRDTDGNLALSKRADKLPLIEKASEPDSAITRKSQLSVEDERSGTTTSLTLDPELELGDTEVTKASPELAIRENLEPALREENQEANILSKISLEALASENWFDVIRALKVDGHGLQVLLNSTASFLNGSVHINYLTKMEPLLTNKASQSIITDIREYFSDSKLKVIFNGVEETTETPREKISRLYEIAVDDAQQKLESNPQIKKLMEKLGATLARESIVIETSRNFVRG